VHEADAGMTVPLAGWKSSAGVTRARVLGRAGGAPLVGAPPGAPLERHGWTA
jgi:hypothetical protein